LPILHWRLDYATFSRDGFIAEVVKREGHIVVGGLVSDNSVLKIVNKLKILFLEDVMLGLRFVQRRDPAGVNSEIRAEFFSKISLFNIGA
jgi:hypothetical protein